MTTTIFRRCRAWGARALVALGLAAGLAGCGGGGGDTPPPNLTVNVNYDDAANADLTVFKSATPQTPRVDGLDGHTPQFEVASGSLPEGMTLDAGTGTLSGRPLGATDTTAVIRLTVPGYAGHVDSELHFSVRPFFVMYPQSSVSAQRGLAVAGNRPMTPSYDPAVSVSFELWPAGSSLPEGLTMDPATGEIGGTPMQEGSYAIFVVGKAAYDGRVSQVEARLDYFVDPITDVGFGYDGMQAEAGLATSVTPYKTLQPGDTLTNFHVVAGEGTGVPGMTLNSTTGVISGTLPSTPGDYNMVVEATFTRGSIAETRRGEWTVNVYVP